MLYIFVVLVTYCHAIVAHICILITVYSERTTCSRVKIYNVYGWVY